jgi:PiT family inorganic phosphate transporter
MALGVVAWIGIATAVFVGVNIGGSSTGVAFGPATGAGVLGKRTSQALMAVFVLAGGLLVGPNVVETLGNDFVPSDSFTPSASTAVLLFTGLALVLGNVARVSASTSFIVVGAVVGMGAALGVLNWETVGEVVTWWFLSSVVAFWLSAVLARYLYHPFERALGSDSEGRERALKGVIIGVGCFMAFSAGASNVANAVAPLVGSGQLPMIPAILLAGVAIGVGAFAIGGRTMDTVGNEIAEIPLEGWVFVNVLAAAIITGLSWLGIPASLALTLQVCVMGFGWGHTTRELSLLHSLGYPPRTAEERVHMASDQMDAYNVDTTRRILTVWLITPVIAGALAFAFFVAGARFGWLV